MPPPVLGAIASSALVVGADVGVRWRLPATALSVLLGLAAGSLMAAVAFDLAEPALHAGGALPVLAGFTGGATAFTAADTWLDRYADPSRGPGRGTRRWRR